jgi:hypothetical protein
MIEALKTRIKQLESEIKVVSGDEAVCKDLLEDLERHVEELEARGGKVPASALALVRPDGDCEIEDQFDNMPI